jgi:hypothetical protein
MTLVNFEHNGRSWQAVKSGANWFARDDKGNDTGPYSTWREAIEWVLEIRP